MDNGNKNPNENFNNRNEEPQDSNKNTNQNEPRHYEPNGVYPDNMNSYNSYDSYYGYNGYNNNQYNRNTDKEEEEKLKKQKKTNKIYTITAVVALCLVLCVISFSLGHFFTALTRPDGNDGTVDSGGSSQGGGTIIDGSESLQNGDFVLETVPAEEHYKLSSVYQMTKNTVVEITTESVRTGSFMQQYVTKGAGSGVIIRSDGFIVTNNHVIEGATKIQVTLTSGEKYDAKLVGTDVKSDLAVIKIEATDLKTAVIGKSEDLLVGEEILVVGNPLGSLGGSATNGIVSSTARKIAVQGQLMTLIQTNAAVNPGNSGGAMFNMSGQLVGIVNAKYTDEAVEGIGFAIPIDIAKGIVEDLANFGYVKGRPNLGLKIEYGTSRYFQGVGAANWVTEIVKDSDGDKAGVKVMDQVVSVDGRFFSNSESLNAYLDTLKVGSTVTFVVNRYTTINPFEYTSEKLTFSIVLTEFKPN